MILVINDPYTKEDVTIVRKAFVEIIEDQQWQMLSTFLINQDTIIDLFGGLKSFAPGNNAEKIRMYRMFMENIKGELCHTDKEEYFSNMCESLDLDKRIMKMVKIYEISCRDITPILVNFLAKSALKSLRRNLPLHATFKEDQMLQVLFYISKDLNDCSLLINRGWRISNLLLRGDKACFYYYNPQGKRYQMVFNKSDKQTFRMHKHMYKSKK